MNRLMKTISLVLTLCLLLSSLPMAAARAEEAIDPNLTCTITLGNWPADTAPEAEKALFEGYKATMAKLYPNVTPHPTSGNPATLTVSFAFENARDAIEDFDFIELDFNVKDSLVCLTQVELVSTATNKYKIVEKVGGLDLTSKYASLITTSASSVLNGVTAATYDATAEVLTLTVSTGSTPSLKAPSALFDAGIYGITA